VNKKVINIEAQLLAVYIFYIRLVHGKLNIFKHKMYFVILIFHTHTRTRPHTRPHSYAHTQTHKHTHTPTHTSTNTPTNTHTQTQTHTLTHTHTHTHVRRRLQLLMFTVKQIPQRQSDLSKCIKENWRVYRKTVTYKMYYPCKLIYKIK